MWKLKRRTRSTQTKLISGLVVLGVSCLGLAVFCFYEWHQISVYKGVYGQTQAELDFYSRPVYVAAAALKSGEIISMEKVSLQERCTDLQETQLMSEEDFGKRLLSDVAEGDYLLASALAKEEVQEREVFLDSVEAGAHIESGDRVDIRISYGNGEDYIVLTEKRLTRYENTGIVLSLSEREILLLSSALVDQQWYRNTRVYAVRYPETVCTLSGETGYLPNEEVLAMLSEYALAEERKQLEERLADYETARLRTR